MTEQPEQPPTGKVIRLNVGGAKGTLTTSRGSHVPVRVFERGDFLLLVLMLDDGDDLADDGLDALELEYVSARGVVHFHGQAVLQERDLVRFEISAAPEIVQRREFVRVPSLQDVLVGDETGSRKFPTKAIDLSGGGMLLSRADSLQIDSLVRFNLDLGAGEGAVSGRARVVRTDEEGRRALVFEEISEEDRERLIHFVFERQREALAKVTRGASHRRADG